MSESYPEYLNPFAESTKPKRKMSFSRPFKEIKRSLRRSFRIKNKGEEEVTIRQKTDTIRRIPVSYPAEQFPALPRSRFQERLSKGPEGTNTIRGSNPFDEEDETTQTTFIPRKHYSKRRAPLPPKTQSSQDLHRDSLDVPRADSHWSLTSADTDYSMDNYSRDDVESEVDKDTMLHTLLDFNKEMEKLKDDSNNNVIIKEKEPNNNIPDVVISYYSDTEGLKKSNDDFHESPDDQDVEKEHDDVDFTVTDITSNMLTDESNMDKYKENELFLYYERRSLYISGSNDELNESGTHKGSVSVYITGSTDALDSCNNNQCDKNGGEERDSDDSVPIPKQRKHKLNRDALLGV